MHPVSPADFLVVADPEVTRGQPFFVAQFAATDRAVGQTTAQLVLEWNPHMAVSSIPDSRPNNSS
jgi:hypothetical protein